ncbi:hypothetical protein FHN55_20120 [Streptomyces sp. NP160]|uniref:hypothetical protein n=1 Tax=Streptomyces sp. NP160 TaxID=2586637 RepID=UPI00111A0602|nr:hypothetical protein [Streptomyces sp. NP160]TNM59805.1 hypothetical protein FHN55_20120 [Streptomyces sp. NP160]
MSGDHGEQEAATATLRLHRPATGRAGLRKLTVMIDGEPAGTLAEGATETFTVTPGSHRLWVHLDWSGTAHHEVLVSAGQTADLQVVFAGSTMNPLRDTPHSLLVLQPAPGNTATLREVEPPASAQRRARLTVTSRWAWTIAIAVLAGVIAYASGLRLG